MDYSFKIINSSAGSGKTFNLAIEFISKLLQNKDDDHFKSMLALTFTNKASVEMKDRILAYLIDLKFRRNKIIEDIIIDKTGLNNSYIKQKSSNILEKIFQNYSNFNVITIDSFTNNIIRSITEESESKNEFLIELDNSNYLEEAIDELIIDIDNDVELKELLIEFAKFKLSINKSWDITYDLNDFGLFIDKETNLDQVKYFKKLNPNLFAKFRKQILELYNQNKSNIYDLVKSTFELIYTNGINDDDFSGGYFTGYLKNLISDQKFFIKESIENSLQGKSKLYNKNLEKSKVESIERIRKELLINYLEIKKLVLDLYKINSTLIYLPSLSLISRIDEKIEQIQSDNKTRLISKFNSQLNFLIRSNDAPYIYEKLGSKYVDFFIDEFQDTSELQWKNLIPLISNSIHSQSHDGLKGSLLIVGDPKQSIYRWRGSKFNQFINLIYGHQNPFHFKPVIEKTDINFRSSKQIVDFNSDFFNFLSNKLNIDIYNSMDLNFKQESNKKNQGYVSVDLSENNNFYSKIEHQILDLLGRGFSQSEITILVRKNRYARELIENINNLKFTLISNDILQINNSDNVQFIISILKLSLNDEDYAERKRVIKFLFNQNYFKNKYENINQCLFSNLAKLEINKFFFKISNNSKFEYKYFKSLDILNAIKYCINIFQIDINDPYIIAIVDNVFEFLENNEDSIKEYLKYWKKKSEKINLSISENQDSILISTIHKSKGLEFPAVIIPIYNDKVDESNLSDPIWLYQPFESIEDLKWSLIRKSKNLLYMGDATKEIYESSELNNYLDSINLLYVAFTRAEKELYIISKRTNSNVLTLSSIIQDYLNHKLELEKLTIGKKTKNQIILDKHNLNTNDQKTKKINIISTSKNVNQARYISDTLSKIYRKKKSAKVYVYFANNRLASLVNFFDDDNNLNFTSNHHILDSKILNYDNVLISNMNEGFFPSIDVKDGYLSTSQKEEFDKMSQFEQENKISKIFYKLINSSKEVHLIYDSNLNSFISGEESRYIKQLESLNNFSQMCNRKVIEQRIIPVKNERANISNDDLIKNRLKKILKDGISASTINLFIKNPYLFYEQKILGINDYEESKYLNYMDQGTLIHKVIEKLYKPYIGVNLQINHVNEMKKKLESESLNSFVGLYSKEPKGKNLIFLEVLKEYITNTLNYELDQIKNQKAKIKIISLEENLSTNILVNKLNVRLKGIIDRIDLFNGELRVIDYKSGIVKKGVLDIKNLDKISTDFRYSYLLQLLFYRFIVKSNYGDKEIKDVGICSLRERSLPFYFVKNHSILSTKELERILIDIVLNIIETNEFIDSGNPL